MSQPRRRLDRALVERGLASDEPGAHTLIADGRVVVGGAPALGPSRLVAGGDQIGVLGPPPAFVTRGGHKLSGALDDLGIPVEGRRCLDAGAGAGGFSDCLLQRGAREVVAVDVGYGDFSWKLRNDARVRILERVNIRSASRALLGEAFDLVVADLSFISLALVVPALVAAAAPEADLLLLVKPQFEALRADVGRGGVVVDPDIWARAVSQVAGALDACGVAVQATVASRLRGAAGNQEFFVWGRRGPARPQGREHAAGGPS